MSNDFQDSLECKICYDNYDETSHRPLTLVCENETCGHTYCAACIKELTRRVCPACNAHFKHTTTNWFVIGLLRNPNGSSINTAFINKLKDEIDNLKLNTKELNKILLKILAENNVYYQDVKQKIDAKVLEANAQLKSIQENLIDEFLCIRNTYEKVLNENKLFETEVQERIKLWLKQLNSGEFKSSSEKLNRIYVEIEIYMKTIEEKKNSILNYIKLNEVCYFDEKYFKLDKKLLGEIKKTTDKYNHKLLRFKFIIGFKMFLNGFWHLMNGFGYFLLGFWYLFTALFVLIISCIRNSKINFNFNEDLLKKRLRSVISLLTSNSTNLNYSKCQDQRQHLQMEYEQPFNDESHEDCLNEEEAEILIEYSNTHDHEE